jgi:ABC-type polysaccharide/polyol phosphate transport system ATPase subunit
LSTAISEPQRPGAAARAAEPAAISIRDVSKTFRIPHQRYSTLKERALHPLRARRYNELHAVNDLSVEIADGEFFGIVGRNGSGKSTLLKCIAGIYALDAGTIDIRGRLSPFIELGVGFNSELAARDNVTLNAIMLGLSRKQARERFDAIIAFAELEEFIDLPLKNYSSGMAVRLAFSVAIEVNAEVLLIDEVLAVGDAAFQQKCFEQFERLRREGRTIVFVTHDMSAVERFCDRALLMDRGRMMSIGEPHAIALAYNELNFGRLVSDDGSAERAGDRGVAEIRASWFEDESGERIAAVAQGERCAMCMQVLFHSAVEDPVFAFALRNEPRHIVFATSSDWHMRPPGRFAAGETVTVRVRFDNWLAPNRYTLSPSVARAGAGADKLDLREDLTDLVVHATRTTGGIADVPHEFEVERA